MSTEYKETDKKTEDGKIIYHEKTEKRGRPRQFVKENDQYVPLKK